MLLVACALVPCLLIGQVVSLLHEASSSSAMAFTILGVGLLACVAIVMGALRIARRRGVQFFDSGFRPGAVKN